MSMAAIILAGGASRRMGRCKQTLPWINGKALICQLVEQLETLELSQISVAVGVYREEIQAALQAYVVTFIEVPHAGNQLISLQTALEYVARNQETQAVLVMPSDLPLLDRNTLQIIKSAYRTGINIAPQHNGIPGHPVIFDRSVWPQLLVLSEDKKPRSVLQHWPTQRPEMQTSAIIDDIDTIEDYQRALEQARNSHHT